MLPTQEVLSAVAGEKKDGNPAFFHYVDLTEAIKQLLYNTKLISKMTFLPIHRESQENSCHSRMFRENTLFGIRNHAVLCANGQRLARGKAIFLVLFSKMEFSSTPV